MSAPTSLRPEDQEASRLIEDSETILSIWEDRVRERVLEDSQSASSHILRNNLSALIDAIARVIRDPYAQIEAKVIDVAHDHANERVKLTDFSLPNILDEYSIFRQVVLEHLQQNEPLPWDVQRRIHLAIDRSVREATVFFVEQNEHLETVLKHEREQFLQRLGAANRRLEAVLDQMPVGVTLAERPHGKLVYINRAGSQILGMPIPKAQEYSSFGQNFTHLDHTPYQWEEYPLARAALHGERIEGEELLYRRGDSRLVQLSVHAAPVTIAEDEPDLAVAMFYDTSALKEAQAALAEEQEFAQVTLEAMGDGVITTDVNGRVERMNPAAERLTGWTRPFAQGAPVLEVVQLREEDGETPAPLPVLKCLAQNRFGETRSLLLLKNRNGDPTPITYSLAPIHGLAGQVIGTVTIIRDASLEWRMLEEMSHEAQHDALTGLVNRREFERRLQQALGRVQEEGEPGALLYLDLDQFKQVNDTCGHAAGDALLVQLATILGEHIRERDTLARLGGDEFAILLDHCRLDNALDIANSLRETVKKFVFHWDDQPFQIGVSIGVLEINRSATSVRSVINSADDACYRAKEAGRNRVQIADPLAPATKPAKPRINWAALVEKAIKNDGLLLYAQEIMPLTEEQPARQSLEFLVRLAGPEGRVVQPDTFMPAAERHNLMPALDCWVLGQVLTWLRTQQDAASRFSFYAINVSAYTLNDESAQDRLMELLAESPVPNHMLCFEISELAGTRNLSQAARFVSRLKQAGFSACLEDVGTGTTSFRHFKHLPVDYLKIDGSFVEGMKNNNSDVDMVRSICEVAHVMGKRTIAQYVDSEETIAHLRKMGVDYAQGYYICSPKRLDEVWADQSQTSLDGTSRMSARDGN